MAKKPAKDAKRYPSRQTIRNVAIADRYWTLLRKMAAEDERSVNSLVRLAVREFLERKGVLDD